jgi:hypothetical protein
VTPEQQEDDIIAAMLNFGGGFVVALARAYIKADAHNRERIRTAFPEYWQHYVELAQRARVRS